MQNRNFSREMEALLATLKEQGRRPTLLLHSCCAPCSSYVLEYLCPYFDITVYFYNPNIHPIDEYDRRLSEQERLIGIMQKEHPTLSLIKGEYDTDSFFAAAEGLEDEKEGGKRCEKCFDLRLMKTAELAQKGGFDFFATTLTVSPHKNAALINSIGEESAAKHSVDYLASDFKKKGGYQRSIVLSKQFDLYRQNYCGCAFAME